MNLKDPFVRSCAQGLVVIVALLMVLPGLFAFAIAVDFKFVTVGAGSVPLANAYGFLPSPNSDQLKDFLGLVAIVITALPALVMAVALNPVETGAADQARTFNGLGKCLAGIFAVGVVAAAIAFLTIDPESWGSNHVLETAGLQNVRGWAKSTIQGSVLYLALLFGLKSGG